MILRERITDNYDPDLPWVIECDDISEMQRIFLPAEEWLSGMAGVMFRGRMIGFADEHEATMFYLRFC